MSFHRDTSHLLLALGLEGQLTCLEPSEENKTGWGEERKLYEEYCSRIYADCCRQSCLRTNCYYARYLGNLEVKSCESTLPKKPPTRPETITVTADGDTIQFHHSGDPKDRLPSFIVDGKERPVEIWAENSEQHFVKASWEKSTLVMQFVKTPAPGHSVAYCSERWSLSSDGKTLTKEVPGTVKELYVYDKQ